MRNLLEVFCNVDDFCQAFLPTWQQHLIACGRQRRQRARQLSLSEVMTILIAFHQSHVHRCASPHLWPQEAPDLQLQPNTE